MFYLRYTKNNMANGGKTTENIVPTVHYGKDQAARHMFTKVPTAKLSESVLTVRKRVLDPKAGWDSIAYIYVMDSKNRIRGVASVHDLFQVGQRKKMKVFARKKMIVAHPHSPLRIVAAKAISHNIKALPIVDANKRFIGMVGTDVIFDTLESEHVRDMLSGHDIPEGTSFSDVFTAKVSDVIRWRTPWLVTGLLGGALAAGMLGRFDYALTSIVELAFFIPVMLYMGSAVGNQTQMLFIRGYEYQKLNIRYYMTREIIVDSAIAIIIGAPLAIYAYLLSSSEMFALTIFVAAIVITSTSGIVAIFISWLFIKFHKDPAIGGGPFQTTIQDLISLVIYFTIASLLLF